MKANFYAVGTIIVLVLVCTVWRAGVIGPHAFNGIDDANIYYTYARNITDGFGPVFSAGSEPVEGFTSSAWLLLLTLGNIITNGNIDIVAFALSFVCVVALLSILLIVLRLQTNWIVAWLVILTCVTTGGYIDWLLMSGMDTCLWSLELLAAAVLLSMNSKTNIGLILILSALVFTRPEGMIIAPVVTIADIVFHKRRYYHVIPIIFVLAGFLIIRLLVFAYPLPNTYYAKVSPSILTNLTDGFTYIAKWIGLTSLPAAAAYLYSVAVIVKNKCKHIRPVVLYATGLSTLLIIIVIIEGGDHFYLSRFLQPSTALIWLSVGILLYDRYASARKNFIPACVFAAAIVVNQVMPLSMIKSIVIGRPIFYHTTFSKIAFEFDLAAEGRAEGMLLQSVFSGGRLPTLGSFTVGGISYAYRGVVIDLLGLNNERIAHAPIEGDYGKRNHRGFRKSEFYTQPPDVLYGFTAPTDSAARAYSIDSIFGGPEFDMMTHGLVHEARFQEMYDLYHVQNGNLQAWVFARNKWVEGIQSSMAFRRVSLHETDKSTH